MKSDSHRSAGPASASATISASQVLPAMPAPTPVEHPLSAPTSPWMVQRPVLLPALALWGWQADLLIPGLIMGVLFEAPRLTSARIDISRHDFDRLWNFTAVLFLAVLFYLFIVRQGLGSAASAVLSVNGDMRGVSDTALTFLRWWPFITAPFMLAHAWSRTVLLPWSTFSLYEQSRAKRAPHVKPPEWALRPMNPGLLYLGVVLFASTISADHRLFYPLALVAVLVLALWPMRNRSYRWWSWSLLVLAARQWHQPAGVATA